MHEVCFAKFPQNAKKEDILKYVLRQVATHGDQYGTEHVEYPTSEIFADIESAEKYILQLSGFYGGYAVQFYEQSTVTAEMKKIADRIKQNQERKNKYEAEHSVKKFKADFVGCKACGSKLNKQKLRGETCPLCYTDLRSPTTLKQLEQFNHKEKMYKEQYRQAKPKDKKKTCWLVKYEYHV